MKKTISMLGLTALMTLACVGSASALTIGGGATEVGALDNLMTSSSLADYGNQTVIDWVSGQVGSTVTMSASNDGPLVWNAVDGNDGFYAYALSTAPAYFVVKTGTPPGITNDIHLFENLPDMDWGVINLMAMGFDQATGPLAFTNTEVISFVREFDGGDGGTTPIPEPATMLLFGSGLASLAGLRRRKMNQI